MDEAIGRMHLFGMGRRGFDEIAEDVVVFDLERRDAGLARELCLHPGNDRPTLVAEFAGLIEVVVGACGDEATVACKEGWIGDQHCVQFGMQGLMARECMGGGGDEIRCVPRDEVGNCLGLSEPIPDCRQIARPAAIEGEPRQCPVDIGDAPQALADICPEVAGVHHEADRIEPRVDR